MKKQQETKLRILDIAFEMASENGLESLTIGELAKQANMSKSGLFAHFNSRHNLQAAVVRFASDKFQERVVVPCQQQRYDTQEQKLRELLANWLSWNGSFQGSCLFLDAWRENSDDDDVVQNSLREVTLKWLNYLNIQVEKAMAKGEFRKELDAWQKVYELYGLYLSSHLFENLTITGDSKERFWLGIEQLFIQCRVKTACKEV
ncbi:TetR family transcriptional regulator [Veronia nyctiphanis]|uniref:TetR family transcriptional regulator n=1 Tax=Veronia nyctiphanis TaxID=1278244 RepID=A0A4Q0YQ41_9GAMM|nr:TetR/AcrR family transcriptional regulator [Veronia nyctiphanis]RXJ72124.1 TetR family transcriptional regulator [Veronia nyctiphanis]